MKKWKSYLKKYSQAWVLLYAFLYFPWFYYLEKTVTTDYTLIHCKLDDMIPFCEWFIIPYFIWFFFIGGSILYFLFFRSKKEFYQLTGYLFVGMTICLLICTIFPNGLHLRPEHIDRNDILAAVIYRLYRIDTNTNVFPSIHVFASIAVCAAYFDIYQNKYFWRKCAILLLTICICLSTVFLKQHSVIDVAGGLVLGGFLYLFFYKPEQVVVKVGKKNYVERRFLG